MRLRRRAAPTGRRKLQSESIAPSPPPAYAYRARRSVESREAPPLSEPARAAGAASRSVASGWLQRFGLIVLLIAAAASVINVLSLSKDANVVLVNGQGSQKLLRPLATYQQAADRQLAGSIWNRNKITIDTAAVSRSLLQQFPELSSVSVTVPLLAHRPLVYVQPAQPTLLLIEGNGSFVIGSNGKALLAATGAAAEQAGLPVVDDQNGLNVRLNHQALSANSITFITTVIGELAAKQFAVSGMTLPPGGAELDAHLAGQPYFIKFNLESTNAKGEAGTFLATITQLRRQNVTPSQYVDVRVDGRAYYK